MRKSLVTLGLVGAALLAPWSSGAPLAQTNAAARVAGPPSGAATARVIVKYKTDAASSRKTIQAADPTPTATLLANRAQSLGARLGVALSAGNSIGARSHVVSAKGSPRKSSRSGSRRRRRRVRSARPDAAALRGSERPVLVSRPRSNDTADASGGGPLVGQWYLKPPGAAGAARRGTAPASINAERRVGHHDRQRVDRRRRARHRRALRPCRPAAVAAGGKLLPGYDMISRRRDSANDGDGRDADASDPGDAVTPPTSTANVPGCTPAEIGNELVARHADRRADRRADQQRGRHGQRRPQRARAAGARARQVRRLRLRHRRRHAWAAGHRRAGRAGQPDAGARHQHEPRRRRRATAAAGATRRDRADRRASASSSSRRPATAPGTPSASPANCAGVIGGRRPAPHRHQGRLLRPRLGNRDQRAGRQLHQHHAGHRVPVLDPDDDQHRHRRTGRRRDGGSTYSDSFDKAAVGTSFSAPLVAGTVALMLSAQPQLSSDEVRFKLQSTARPFPSPTVDESGGALQACTAPTATSPDQLQCVCKVGLCGAGMLDARRRGARCRRRAGAHHGRAGGAGGRRDRDVRARRRRCRLPAARSPPTSGRSPAATEHRADAGRPTSPTATVTPSRCRRVHGQPDRHRQTPASCRARRRRSTWPRRRQRRGWRARRRVADAARQRGRRAAGIAGTAPASLTASRPAPRHA